MLWLLAGLTIGTLNGLTLRWTVNRLRPDAALTSVPLVVLGFLMRLGFAAGLLVIALQRDIGLGLLAFAGLWLARWVTIYITLPHRSLLARLLRK
jgi:hypothetical protein